MPIYEYQCKSCDHVFDVLQKLSDEPLTYCPECGKPELRKLLSAPNFRLKGGGWYETDFKDKNKRNLAGDSGAPSSDSAASDKSGSDKSSGAKTDSGSAGSGKSAGGKSDSSAAGSAAD